MANSKYGKLEIFGKLEIGKLEISNLPNFEFTIFRVYQKFRVCIWSVFLSILSNFVKHSRTWSILLPIEFVDFNLKMAPKKASPKKASKQVRKLRIFKFSI